VSEQAGPDPRRAADLTGLVRELNLLRRQAAVGTGKAKVGLDELTRRVGLPRSTLHTYLTGRTVPPAEVLDKIVIALGGTATEQRAWAEAWFRVSAAIDRQRVVVAEAVPAQLPGAVTGVVGREDHLRRMAAMRRERGDTAHGDRDRAGQATARAVSAGQAAGQGLAHPVPAQLPAKVSGFTGRRAGLAELDALLDRAHQAGTTGASQVPAAVVISAVSGTAGVGKTALAVWWAHRVAGRFPDGQLYVNLRGFEPDGQVTDPTDAMRGFLDALDVPAGRIPASLDAQAALFRSLLAGRRMLIVLDNARDTAQVRALLPGAPGCLALVTSRNQLAGLVATYGAHPITLDLLPADEARHLLAHRIGPERMTAEPQAVEDIIARCARLPLALAIVAARAATHPHLRLAALADELRDSRHRLDTLTCSDDPNTDVRAVLSWSYNALTAPAARLFRLLGLHPGPDISIPAAASLGALLPTGIPPVLAELARANLIAEHVPGRYTFHDLLRAYATDVAQRTDPDQQRHDATHRILDHYLHTALAADLLMNPTRDPIAPAPPQPGTTPEHLTDYEQALAWFTAEHAVMLAAVDHATGAGLDTHTWQLAWTLATFLDRRGHWNAYAATQRAALAAAERLDDATAQATANRLAAVAYISLGRFGDADASLRQSLGLFRQAGDHLGQAHANFNLAMVLGKQGRHHEALGCARQAVDLYRAAGDQAWQARALNNVGWLHTLLGDHAQSLTYCQQSLSLLQGLGNRQGQAHAWDSLGYAHHHLGHHTQAITCYRQALDLFRDLGDRYNEADILTHIGETHHTTGNLLAARHAWQQAQTILTDLDHPDAEYLNIKLATTPTEDVGSSRPSPASDAFPVAAHLT
jgi:tetratricopeptide (TPR) repeat protein